MCYECHVCGRCRSIICDDVEAHNAAHPDEQLHPDDCASELVNDLYESNFFCMRCHYVVGEEVRRENEAAARIEERLLAASREADLYGDEMFEAVDLGQWLAERDAVAASAVDWRREGF